MSNNSSEVAHDNDNGNRKLNNMSEIDTEVSKAIQAALHDLDIYSSSNSSDQLSKIKDNYLAEENSESEPEYDGEGLDADNFRPVEAEANRYNMEFNETDQQVESLFHQSENLNNPTAQDCNKLMSDSDITNEDSNTSVTKERYSSKNIISLDVNILKSDISSGSECGSPGLPELIEIPAVSARKSTVPFGDRLKDSIKTDSSLPKFDLNLDDAEINEEEGKISTVKLIYLFN